MSILTQLYKKHNNWLEITQTFGVNPDTAQDIVSELYIKIDAYVKLKGDKSIMYNDKEINYFFIYVTIRNLIFDLKRKEKKVKAVSLETLKPEEHKYVREYKEDLETQYIDDEIKLSVITDWYENDKYLNMLNDSNLLDSFSQDKMKVYYLRLVFKEIFLEKNSVSSLSRNTKITYWSLRNTIKNIKKQIKLDYENRKSFRDCI